MKILVAGIGGIGGWLAATFAKGGADVELFARGSTLQRLRKDGLTVVTGDRRETFALKAFDSPTAEQRFDVIIVCVKTQDFPVICRELKPLLTEGTHVVAAVNGLPWWFIHNSDNSPPLESIDPGGMAESLLASVTPIGAVVHASAHVLEAGVIRVVKADRLILGDVPEYPAIHTREIAAIAERGGTPSPVVGNIQEEIWAKLWGNMNMNPVSALTRLSSMPILERPDLRALILAMMDEFDAIGRKLGLTLPMTAAERIDVTKKLGDFRTSMLADAEAHRRLEHEGILGCVVELAGRYDVDIPTSRLVYTLLKGLDHSFAVNRRS